MKRKHFILALVAMLWSFSFSAFADDVIVVNSWAELKAALEANDDVQRSAARQRSTAMRATDAGTEVKTPIEGTPYFYEDFDGTKVQLGDDVVYDSPMTVAKLGGATIDLNGHKVLGSEDAVADHTYPIVSNGNLLVVDTKDGSGAIYCGIKTGIRNSDSNINSNAVFVMTGGNIICAHENDDDAALVNYGIAYLVGGSIEGAKNAVWNNSGAQFFAKEPALIEGEVRNDGASNIEDGVPVVAKIGTAKYTSLNAAFAAAKEGETIKMLADATPTLKSQSAITKAAVIDLNGKTLTLDKGDLYFGTTTFQNGNVVVKPGVNASTAVFWMFEKQTLTFNDVDVVATGVTGTYLIGINGGTGTAVNILNGSSITIDNSSVEKLTAVICDNGTNNNVTIDNSTITVNNIDGRFYLGGTKGDIVVNNSAVTLNGVKEGFYLRADQNLDLKGSSNVTVTLNSDEGRYGINCTEFTSIYNKEASATYTGTFFELQAAAMIGTTKYVTLQKAIDAVKNGETIVLVSDCAEAVTFTQTKDVSFVLDGNNKTYTGSINITARAGKDAASTLVIKNFNFKTDAIAHDFIKSVETNYYPNNITITGCSFEGTSDVNTAGYAVVAVRLKSANNIVITNCIGSGLHSFLQNTAGWNMQIDNVDVTNSLSGFAMGTIQGATIKNCELDVVESGIRFDAQLNNNAVLENNNVKAFVPVVVRKASVDSNIAVNGTNTMTQSNTDGYWMVIGTSEYKVNGELPTAATGRVRVSLNDDDLSEDGIYGNFVAIAKIGENEYASLQEAIKAVKNGETITLLRDDCAEDVVVTQAPDVKITIDGNNKEFAGTITVDGKSAAYATAGLTIKYVKFLADGISKDASINLGGSNAIRYTSNVTVEGCTFTGTNKDKVGIKSYTGGDKNLTITNCFANGMHSLAQVKNVTGVTVSGCTIENSKNGIALGQSTNVAISGANITTEGYGIRVDATQATTMTVTDAKIDANIPVVARKATGDYNIDFNGDNTFTADNADHLWLAIGQEELYDTDNNITTDNLGAATGNMIVTLNDNFNAPGANVIGAVAHLGNKYYTKLQEAINACVEGDNTINVLAAIVEDVTIVQQEGINVVLEGNENTFDGTIYIEGQSRNEGAETLTIQNVNFTTSEASHYFIDSNSTESAKRYAHNVTINGCDFTATGAAVNTAVAARIRQGFDIKFVGGEFTGLHSVLQGYGIAGVELDGVKAVSCKNGAALGTSTNAVVKNVDFDCAGYGIRVDASVATTLAVENSTIKAMIPVVGRKATADYSIVFNGTNEFGANNDDNNVWCVVGAEEYGDVTLDKVGAVTGNATVTLNDTGLNKAGIHAVKATIDKVCYFSFADALAAAKAGETITMYADVEATEVILLDKSITIDGNGHKVTSNATRVFRVTTANTEVTLNDVNMVNTAVRVGTNDIRGISVDDVQNVQLTLNNCSVDFTDASANDWTYAVNVVGGSGHVVTVNDGTYEGANVINVRGANNTVTVKDATLTSLYPANDVYYGAAIWVQQNQGSSVEATGNTFNGNHAIAFNLGTGTALDESNNTDNTKLYVAKADADKYYYTFAEAVAEAGNTVKLLRDFTGEGVVIDKDLTIDFNGKTYTVNKTVGSAGTTTLGFQILKDNNVTLKNGTLTSTAVAEGKEVKMLVQNYANLTVDNMKLVDATDHILYVLSNNSGTVNVVNGSEITTDAIALDACKYASYEAPTVTVAEGVKVTGDVEASAALNFAGTLNGNIVINGVDGKVTTAQDKKVTTTVDHYNVNYADGAYALVHKIYVAKIGENQYEKFAEALEAVQDGETIVLTGAEGSEVKTEKEFIKDIKFTITGKAPKYALPVVTFQNAEVTIKDAEILIPELDARENATINVVNSTVHDAGGNSIAKSYYNGTINIDKTSTVYMMQVTTMGYINVAGTLNATWQTNVYGNGMISLAEGATFNTAALHLTGQDYSNRNNTAADRVGKPATIVVDAATLNVGSVKSDNGADYSYNSSKGINVGTVDGKNALLDIKNGGAVNFYMANGQTTNFGAGATVNVDASTLKTISRDENGTVTLANAGNVVVTGASNLNIKNFTGNAINATNATLADVQFGGAVNAFGTNNISGTSVIGGILSVGYGTNTTEQVVVNITGNFNGTNVLVGTINGVDNILNVGKADGERTTVHFAQLGAFADVNIVNTDVTYGYAFIRNDFNATNSTFEIKGGVNTYFSGNAKVVLDNTTWNLKGYANIGSYGGYMYGNADVTLKNGSSMTATNLGVEVSGDKVVNITLEDTSNLTATKLTNQGSIVLASIGAYVTSNTCDNITTNVTDYKVAYVNGVYKVVPKDYVAKVGDARFESLAEALTSATDGATVELLWSEGAAPISMAGTVCGNKTVTITGTAQVDWSKGWLYVGRNGEGNGKVIFNEANLTSTEASLNNGTYGINVSMAKSGSNTTNDGEVVFKNSNIDLSVLIGKNNVTVDGGNLTVWYGFAVGARPASETNNVERTVTMNIVNGAKVVVKNHNGQGLGYEAIGVMNIDKTSTFETTKPFLVTAKGTMNVAGTVKIAGALTNKGAINFTDLAATLATTTNNLTIGYDHNVIPESYKVIYDNNGVYRFAHYVARIDDVHYESLQAALEALEDGKTLVLLEDIEISDKWSTFGVTAAATIDGNTHTLTFTGEVNDGDNYNGIFRFENNMAVKNLTIDASQATLIKRGITAKLGITVDSCEFIGNGNGYAVIFGEGAEVEDLANAEVSITNSTFTNWSKGVSDNANGEDAKSVTISHGNVFNNASVNVSAKVKVTFTENTVNNGDVIITSYSNAVGVEVQAGQTGSNKLNGNGVYQIISNPAGIFAQAQFSVPVAYIGTKYYLTLQEAVDVDNSDIYLVDDVKLTKAVVVEGKTVTLNLNGNFIKPIDDDVTMTGGLIRLLGGANLTINGEGEITSNGNHNVYAAVSVLGNDAHLTVEGGKLTGYYYGIAGNGYREGTEVTINGGEIASIEATGAGIYHPQNGTLAVTGGTITGATGIYFKGGNLAISGGTVKGTGAKADYVYSGNGFNATGDALVIENVAEGGYDAIEGVSITGGKFISDNAAPIASYGDSKLVEFLGKDCYALFNKEFDESLLVVGYQLKDEDNDGYYGVKWTNYRQSMVFVDGEFTEYTHTQDMTVGELTYIRASIPTTWTPIYLPFEVPVSLLADKFEVAYINGVRRGDTNFDGQLDDFVMEIIYIHGGNADGSRKTLKANYPYFIRSKNGVREDLNITVSDATLYAAAKAKPYDCTSMTEKYTLIGNLSQVTIKGSDDKVLRYTVSSGNWSKRTKDSELKPFRFSMEITSRDEEYNPIVSSAPVTMSIAVRGEEREDGTTLIYDIEEEQTVDYIYDLHGRRVMEPQKGGIYIINGKKVVF